MLALLQSAGPYNQREVVPMSQMFTAIIQRSDDWWIGWVKEVRGVNAQERTRAELLVSLRCAL